MADWLKTHWRGFLRSGPENIYTYIWWAILTGIVVAASYIGSLALSYLFPKGSHLSQTAEKWRERFLIATIALAIPLVATLLARGVRRVNQWIQSRKLRQQQPLPSKLEFVGQVFCTPTEAMTLNTGKRFQVIYVQLLPRCMANPVEQCRGRLLRVMKLKLNGNKVEPTDLDEPLDLIWSNHSSDPITLEPSIDQRLNLLTITTNEVELQVNPKPLKAHGVFVIDQDFRLDVVVTGKECAAIQASVKIRFGAQTIFRTSQDLPLPFVVGIIDDPKENSN